METIFETMRVGNTTVRWQETALCGRCHRAECPLPTEPPRGPGIRKAPLWDEGADQNAQSGPSDVKHQRGAKCSSRDGTGQTLTSLHRRLRTNPRPGVPGLLATGSSRRPLRTAERLKAEDPVAGGPRSVLGFARARSSRGRFRGKRHASSSRCFSDATPCV